VRPASFGSCRILLFTHALRSAACSRRRRVLLRAARRRRCGVLRA
jgi:hypothetical protein